MKFAGVTALDDVDLSLHEGEILGLIGPNGAGKTTFVNVLSGFERPTSGRSLLNGIPTTGWSPDRLARAGLARTFQNVRLFASMSAQDNVEAAGLGSGLRLRDAANRATQLLALVDLTDKAGATASALPYGDQRLLGIARALATAPSLLLLDEPAAGLNEIEGDALMRTLSLIREELGCGLLLIEHDMRLVMGLCDRIQVLDYGKTIAVGTPDEVRADPLVIRAYLSGEGQDADGS